MEKQRVKVYVGDEVFFAPWRTVKMRMDEDGIQWVRFEPTNGPDVGKEHVVRTDRVRIVQI